MNEHALDYLLHGEANAIVPAGRVLGRELSTLKEQNPDAARREAIAIGRQCIIRIGELHGDARHLLIGTMKGLLSNGGAVLRDLDTGDEELRVL